MASKFGKVGVLELGIYCNLMYCYVMMGWDGMELRCGLHTKYVPIMHDRCWYMENIWEG